MMLLNSMQHLILRRITNIYFKDNCSFEIRVIKIVRIVMLEAFEIFNLKGIEIIDEPKDKCINIHIK